MGKPHESYLMVKTKSPLSLSARIPRAPKILRSCFHFITVEISLGPYHYRMLHSHNDMKPIFRDKLVSGDNKKLEILYDNLAGMVKELRGYYEENDTCEFSDEEFTRMMLLDGCFILSFIKHILHDYEIKGLRNHRDLVKIFREDIFLLENQIPYQVLNEVMKVVPDDMWELKINRFLDTHSLVTERGSENDRIPASTNHLLELLQRRVTERQGWSIQVGDLLASSCKVRELRTWHPF